MNDKVLNVCITGAAGHIATTFYPLLGSGEVFGPTIYINLLLLELKECMPALEGVRMQIEDCAFELIRSVTCTDDPAVAFKDIDLGIFLGGQTRKPGMERSDLLQLNNEVFKSQGEMLSKVANPNAKLLVVANPSNTNCVTLMQHCPNIPRKNFTSLMMLDHNRTISLMAKMLNTRAHSVRNIIVWGNHSLTQFPDVSYAEVNGKSILAHGESAQFFNEEFMTKVQKRGNEILTISKHTSVLSGAKALKDHLHLWYNGTEEGQWISFGVITTGEEYGIPEGYCYSMPVRCRGFEYEIVKDLLLSETQKIKLMNSLRELKHEKDAASEN